MANEEKREISISINKQAAQSALQTIKSLQDAQKDLAASATQSGRAYEASAKKVSGAQKEQARATRESGTELENQAKALNKVKEAADDAANSLNKAGKSGGGSIGGQVADIRGAVGSLSGGGGAGLEIASGIGDAVEAFGSLNPAVAASTVAIVALNFVMGSFTQAAEKQAKVLQATLDAQGEVVRSIASGLTTEDAQEQLRTLEAQRQAEQDLLNTRQAAYDEAISRLGIAAGLAQQIAPQEQVLADAIDANKSAIAGYDAQIRLLNNAINTGELAANDTSAAEAELAQTREQESQRAIQAAEQSAARVAQLQQQQADLINNRAIAEANANQVEALERRYAREDEKAEQSAHYAELAKITETGQAKIAAINQEIAKLPALQAQAELTAQSKANAELGKLQSEYFETQQKAWSDFATEQGRVASDTAKAAKRLAEDLSDNLADAARANDVVSFLKIQRDGAKEQRRNAEDAKTEEKRRVEDFLKGQEEERQAFLKRQSEINQALAQERQQIAQSFAERRNQLEQQRQQEQANTQQALANAKTRYEQQQAAEDLAARRNAERQALREQQEQAAFQRQIAAINQKMQAELNASNQVTAAYQRLVATASSSARSSVSGLASNVMSSIAGGYKQPYSKSYNASSGNTINANITVGDVATGAQVSNALSEFAKQWGAANISGISGAQS